MSSLTSLMDGVQILDMLSANEKAIKQLGEMFNRVKGTGTRSWLPLAPSLVLFFRMGPSGRPSYRVSILE